jgi:hypothetical protein
MGLLTKAIKFNGLVLVGGTGFTAYQYPELRKNPGQLIHAMTRMGRLGTTAVRMAGDYGMAKEITSETHHKASQRMYECFKVNGGPYIKLG